MIYPYSEQSGIPAETCAKLLQFASLSNPQSMAQDSPKGTEYILSLKRERVGRSNPLQLINTNIIRIGYIRFHQTFISN